VSDEDEGADGLLLYTTPLIAAALNEEPGQIKDTRGLSVMKKMRKSLPDKKKKKIKLAKELSDLVTWVQGAHFKGLFFYI
jgi:hypothetical protein